MKFNDVYDSFLKLSQLFNKEGYNIFLVGGTVRDYLLNIDIDDVDLCGDATIEEVEKLSLNLKTPFKKYGSIRIVFEGITFDYTTLRKEKSYLDYRHPSYIEFVKDIRIDFYRRDFTINGLYMDKDKKIYDFSSGREDIKYHLIRTIGNSKDRIKEDPLRILRAIRFSLIYDFDIEESLYFAILEYGYLLDNLNQDKVKEEIIKMINHGVTPIKIRTALKQYHININKNIIPEEVLTYGRRSDWFLLSFNWKL